MHRREGKGLRASSGVMVALLAAMALLPFSHIPSVSVDNYEDAQTGTITFFSDTTWEVFDSNGTFLGLAQNVCLNDLAPPNCPAGATLYEYCCDGWTTDLSAIPGATWIWAPGITGGTFPAFPAEFSFSKVFDLPGPATSGSISVSVDDFAEVRINGMFVGTTGSVTDGTLAGEASSSLATFDLLPFLLPGTNVITVLAANGDFGCGSGPYDCNPAGVVFGGSLSQNQSAPPATPRHLTTSWDGATQVTLSWDSPLVLPDHYLIYRAGEPQGFADLGSASAQVVARWPGASTAWADPLPLAGPEERYYTMRAADAAEAELTPTSNTAGVFAGNLNAGLTAISRPLEYFPWVDHSGTALDTVEEHRAAFGATEMAYLDSAGSWQSVPGGGDPDTVLSLGNAYLVDRPTAGTFVFTGLPGSMIRFDEMPFAGFDPAADARSLAAAVSGDDVTLAWSAPGGIGSGDGYQVWSSPSRTGFFDGDAALAGTAAFPATTFTDGGILGSTAEIYYWVVPVNAALGPGTPTYSVGVWVDTFVNSDTLALPLRPSAPGPVSAYADAIPGALGILWLAPSGWWVPHFTAMPAGVYDAAVVLAGGYQVSIVGTVRHAFVGN